MALANLEDIIRKFGVERANAPMMTFDGTVTRTYGETQERSNRVANGLLALGVKAGSRVAIVAKNGPAFFETLFGIRKIGAVQVAVNWRLAADEVKFIVEDAGAEVVFFDPELASIATSPVDSVRKYIALGPDFEQWLAAQSTADTDYRSGPDDVALQLYTSGTTGRPKGAMLMNRSVFGFYDAAHRAFGNDPESIHLNCLPLFHVGGINWSLQAFAHGAHVIAFRDFDPDVVIREIERSKVTHLMTVPAVIQLLLSRPVVRTTSMKSLRLINYGGSSISEKVLKDAIATFGHVLHGMYGGTELSFGATLLTPDEHVDPAHPEWLRSVGRPWPGTEIKIVNPHSHEELKEGETGEVWFKSVQRGLGYWKRPEATADTFRDDGWYRSGDLGHQIGGYVFLSDRLNDMVVSGGENIYPAEIERVLGEHDDVAEVVAFGVPDPKWGEAVVAVVVRTKDGKADADTLLAFASERLAKFKRPREIRFAETLPRTPSGKVQRHVLRGPYWEGYQRRIN